MTTWAMENSTERNKRNSMNQHNRKSGVKVKVNDHHHYLFIQSEYQYQSQSLSQ